MNLLWKASLPYFAANPFGRDPLFVTRQRVGRKRAPLRRPSGSLAVEPQLGHGLTALPCADIPFAAPAAQPELELDHSALAKGGWKNKTKMGDEDEEKNALLLLFFIFSFVSSSPPVWRARASQALRPSAEGARGFARVACGIMDVPSGDHRAARREAQRFPARQSGALSFVPFFGRAKKGTRRLGGDGMMQGCILRHRWLLPMCPTAQPPAFTRTRDRRDTWT